MDQQQYEHHLSLRKDKLCPFGIKTSTNLHNSVCNWHKNIEILLVTAGDGRIQYGAQDLPVEKDDVVIVNSGSLHRVYSEDGISFTYIIIDESFCLENGIETESRSFERIFKSNETKELCLNADRRHTEYKADPSQINTARLRHSVLELLINICSEHSSHSAVSSVTKKTSEEYVKKALEYLGDNYTEAISLDALAAVCGITKYHLAREFKHYTGQTVFTFVNVLRCKKAELCLSRGMTVTEAAFESGFESISYFSRTYKKLMGNSPSSEKSKSV